MFGFFSTCIKIISVIIVGYFQSIYEDTVKNQLIIKNKLLTLIKTVVVLLETIYDADFYMNRHIQKLSSILFSQKHQAPEDVTKKLENKVFNKFNTKI